MQIDQVIITGARQASLRKLELPDHPAPGEVRIATEVTVISPGTELAIYTGADPLVHGGWCAWPWKAGYGNVGIVRAVGAGVTRAVVGQRVFTYGKHASVVDYPDSRLLVPVPDGLDPVLAAASRLAGVACTAVVLADTACSPQVAVFGLGMVGNLAAQAFRILGCRVVGIDPNPQRRALAERCGIPTTLSGEGEVAATLRAGGGGPSVVVDATGLSAVFPQAVRACAAGGEVILLGTPRTPSPGDLTPVLSDIHLRNLTVRGALEWNLPHYPQPGSRHSLFTKQTMIFDWLGRGELHLAELISHRLPAARIADAYEGLLNRPGEFTGVVLDWR